MTQDFIDDLITACKKEGAVYFICVSTDGCENVRYFHNYDTLPKFRDYPDGARRTQKEDFLDFVQSIPFTKEEQDDDQ